MLLPMCVADRKAAERMAKRYEAMIAAEPKGKK